MMLHCPIVLLLHLVVSVVGQQSSSDTSRARYGTFQICCVSGPATINWPSRVTYATPRTSSSTDEYRRQYGSHATDTRYQSGYHASSASTRSGTSRTSGTLGYLTTRQQERQRSYYGRRSQGDSRGSETIGRIYISTSPSTTAPPHVESSTGLTHYGTLQSSRGQERARWRGRVRQPQASGRSGGRTAGEGFGQAYLNWTEFGVGCSCDECGTRNCQHFTGVCECFENVVGSQCDRCARDHWGFESCQGCQPCQCGLASYSSQCDEGTGQCQCQEGVTGQRCDHCKPGYWNYTAYGCQECTCREGFSVGVGCDPRTGQCQCLPGVVGANCDHCPYRWVLIDGYGCQECEHCVHSLLDTTDEIALLLQATINEFESAAYSYFLHQRLGVINSSVNELRPHVDLMELSQAETLPLATPLQALLKEAQVMASQADLVVEHASEAAGDGWELHIQALKVQEDVGAAFDLTRQIIAEINRLVIGLETGTGAQLEQAIREAEAILEVMGGRIFVPHADKAEVEQELAREQLDNLKNFYLPIQDQQEATRGHEERLQEFAAKVEEMRGLIEKAQENTRNARQMIHNNEVFGYQSVTNKLDLIDDLSGDVEDSVQESKDLLDQARENYVNLTANLDMLGLSVESLRAKKTTLNGTVITNLEELLDAQEMTRSIPAHVQELQSTAEQLEGLLADTRQVAENALSAANAYENIVMAIDDAYNASVSANMSASRAVEMSDGVSDQALVSQEASEEKHQLAEVRMQRVEQELRPQLLRAQADVSTLREMNRAVDNTLSAIDSGLSQLNQVEFAEKAERLKESAVNAQAEAEEAIQQVNNVENLLTEASTKAQLLNKNIADGNRFIIHGNEHVGKVEQKISEMTETAYLLQEQKVVIQNKGIDVGERLEKLRNYIKQTRELTSKIKVGVSFQPSTTVELQNPQDLTKAATSTKVSLFAQTEDPSGLLMFLGTPKGGSEQIRRTTSDDFMALEVDGGYVRLTLDLGAGPYTIEYNKLFIADGEWTKIMVERTGKVVRLSVEREGMVLEPVEQVMPGRKSVFNLDPRVSKIFVGGIPPGVEVDESISSTSFIGAMEDLRINDQPLGLWNFMQNGTYNNRQRGAMARDRLVNLVPPTGLRFGGEGYAAMNTSGFRFQRQFDLQLDFKTYAEDGILYMITSAPNQYMTLALEEGHLLFQYNLGTGSATMQSDGTFHNGEWHHVEVARQDNRGVLKVGSEQVRGEAGGNGRRLAHVPTMFFGGYPGEHEFREVTNEDFHGCIDKVVVSSVTVDLSKSKETLGTVPGCPIQVASLVSFEPSSPGYVKFGSPEGSGLQLVFKFKTDQPDGLILYASTRSQDSYVSLSLAEGALILRAAPGGELSTGSYDKYNDSEWHVVIASREDNELRLDIDDFKSYKVRVGEQAIPFDGPVFFGGVPEIFKISAAASATDTNFFGCLGDATLNGRIVNFAQTEENVGAHLEKCPLQRITSVFFDRGQEESYLETTELVPLDRCALPEVPIEEEFDPRLGNRFDQDHQAGYTFGNKRISRIEFQHLPSTARADFKFTLQFRTVANDSLIFYASDASHRDFVAMYIKDGKVVFSFNPGGTSVVMRTQESFNNGQWHSIIAERQGDHGVLYVDGFKKANSTVSGDSRFLDLQAPYYYGGINPDAAEMVRPNTEGTDISFNGCLRQLRMNNQRMSGEHVAYAVVPCSDNVEPGIFFKPGPRAHVILLKRFSVGRVFEMTMDIKPRKNSGVIASVHGRRDFVLLELRNGTLKLSVDNGKGIMSVQYKPPSPWSFCDGQWHSVKLIKNKNIAILVVDDITTNPATGKVGATSTDTRNPLFLGSQPLLNKRRGDATTEKYVGCIRNVMVNKEVINLAYATYVGEVDAGACPTN